MASSPEQKLNILHLAKFYPPSVGGIERAVETFAKGAAKKGHNVKVLCFSDSMTSAGSTQQDGVVVERFKPLAQMSSVAMSVAFMRAALRQSKDADIVHLHEPSPTSNFAVQLLPKGKTVVTWHCDFPRMGALSTIVDGMQSRVCKRASRIISTSDALWRSSSVLHSFGDKITVIPYGIDQSRFQAMDGDDAKIQELLSKVGGPFALAVGRLVPYKGFDLLIQAAVQSQTRVVIVGSGPLEEELRKQVAAMDAGSLVHITGGVEEDELRLWYAACSFLTMPSVSSDEAFGMVQAEAMMNGKPCLNTRLPTGVVEVSLHGETGLTIPPRDVDALAEALTTLHEDEELRTRLGKGAYERAMTVFAQDATEDALEQVYRAVAASDTVAADSD